MSEAFRELAKLAYVVDREQSARAVNLLDSAELWARSYAQFVTIRTGDPALAAGLDALRQRPVDAVYLPRQWGDDDFSEIEATIEDLFWSLGWIA
jgi:hypothetical protein